MPATTPGGMPYPLGTDPIADGDDAIKNLALAITGPVAAAFTLNATWNAVLPPRLTKVAGRWLLTLTWQNAAGGTFGAGFAPLGTLPTVARSGVGTFRAPSHAGGLTGSSIVDVDTATGAVQWFLPNTVTVGAANISGAINISWDGQPT